MTHAEPTTELVKDAFSLTRVRQMAAMLDQDPAGWHVGDVLPRGWHVALFATATRQSALRPDGFAGVGVPLPDTGLPRLMFGGRRVRFLGDLVIGEPARRVSRLIAATPKQGRSGKLLIVTVQHDILTVDAPDPVVIEEQDYVLLEATSAPVGPDRAPTARPGPAPDASRECVPDETLLLRYCALTFNTHRIHYDHPFATAVEGYPALVVNGGLTTLMLTELFRAEAGQEPAALATRNVRPLFCGRRAHLRAARGTPSWRLWAEDEEGRLALEADVQ